MKNTWALFHFILLFIHFIAGVLLVLMAFFLSLSLGHDVYYARPLNFGMLAMIIVFVAIAVIALARAQIYLAKFEAAFFKLDDVLEEVANDVRQQFDEEIRLFYSKDKTFSGDILKNLGIAMDQFGYWPEDELPKEQYLKMAYNLSMPIGSPYWFHPDRGFANLAIASAWADEEYQKTIQEAMHDRIVCDMLHRMSQAPTAIKNQHFSN